MTREERHFGKYYYLRNNEKAPYLGDRFAQDIEPKGKYISLMPKKQIENFLNYLPLEVSKNYEFGIVEFRNPLIIEHVSTGHGGWKTALYNMYGEKGLALSRAIVKDGYDAVMTVDNKEYSTTSKYRFVEVVDLRAYA